MKCSFCLASFAFNLCHTSFKRCRHCFIFIYFFGFHTRITIDPIWCATCVKSWHPNIAWIVQQYTSSTYISCGLAIKCRPVSDEDQCRRFLSEVVVKHLHGLGDGSVSSRTAWSRESQPQPDLVCEIVLVLLQLWNNYFPCISCI